MKTTWSRTVLDGMVQKSARDFKFLALAEVHKPQIGMISTAIATI
jgi:hypothetical protein